MSKKMQGKKTKRGFKRTVRRSLAAVLMITAIAVAAIPVPENRAETVNGGVSVQDVAPQRVVDYSYEEPGADLAKGMPKPSASTPEYSSKVLKQLSDSEWIMEWQFRFFLKNVQGGSKGIISEYNSTYASETVVLNPNVVYEYNTIQPAVYEKFYTDHDADIKSCTEPGEDDADFLIEYFPDKYQKFCDEYAAWEKEFADWQKKQDGTPAPVAPTLEVTIGELSETQKLKYYCDANKVLKGCTLIKAIDSENSGATNVYVYIPRKNSGATVEGEFDDNGFMVLNKSSIIGIGDGAFKGTKNVHYLTVPQEVAYIGKEAFMDSFLVSISFSNVQEVSDRAFKGCTQLREVNIGSATTLIGNEAFYDCNSLTSITFPYSVGEIGHGAFAGCKQLGTVDFGAIGKCVIDDYAFYNDIALNTVNFNKNGTSGVTVDIDTIGEAAFAVESGPIGSMSTFTFPSNISQNMGTSGMGDLVLAGRSNLQKVVMPADYGRTKKAGMVTIPENLFYNCSNLGCVEFPDDGNGSCGYVTYDGEKLFSSVSNKNFYVRGPAKDSAGEKAGPRKATWAAKTAVSEVVPYVYVENGKEYYEVSDGSYLLCIDSNGVLISCTIADGNTSTGDIDLVIPSKVGEIQVTGIATDCFNDEDLTRRVVSITIEDDSITSIEDSVFENIKSSETDKGKWNKLQKVVIGNSVASIGKRAFAGCYNLIDVTFHSPSAGHNAFTIGTDAFKTDGTELTFHGDIVKGYAPFEWAVAKENVIHDGGIRVCYKSLEPSCLTVMYDDGTGLVTLLDYPRYDQIDNVYKEHNKAMESYYYELYKAEEYNGQRTAFKEIWQKVQNGETNDATGAAWTAEDAYADSSYGPWINSAFCLAWESYVKNDAPGNVWTDWLFEPLTVEAANDPDPYFTTNPYSILENWTRDASQGLPIYQTCTSEERAWVEGTTNIVIPAGVQSIDVYGYVNAKNNANGNNVATYMTGKLDSKVMGMYTKKINPDADDILDVTPGLFSGVYDDGYPDAEKEKEIYKRGNDRVVSIDMSASDVEYLPDYAFDSCEQLQYVLLSPACKEIGTAPFRGCTSMMTVGGNDYYKTDNGIIYEVNEDGSYTIVECLASRGRLVGDSYISEITDPDIANVTKIREGAFEDCNDIASIDLTAAKGLTEIPENCFKDCDILHTVVLPMNVNSIKKGAFENDKPINVTIPGKEVFIATDAFGPDKDKTITIRTYRDTSAYEYADYYKLSIDIIDEQWRVIFLDVDGTQVGETKYVINGRTLPKEDRPANPTRTGYIFDKWIGSGGIEVDDAITQDTIFIATYTSDGGMVDGKYVVEFYDNVDGKKLGETQYIEPGKDAVAPTPPEHIGYTFLKWSDTYTNVQSNKTVIALYSATSNTSGGSTTTSGGSTTTSGGSTSGKTTSSSNGSTSSTSTSSNTSTSATSTSSGSGSTASLYTVTVVNGSGSGSYAAGTTVVISANAPAPGMVFSKWTTDSNGVSLASVSMTATTFTMPANNVTVTANYVAGSTATAANGNGSGNNGNGNGSGNSKGNTTVDITKPGISNKDLATANVNGSSDNFIVKITETDEATRAVAAALTNKYGSLENILYYAMDISLYDSTGTTKITNTNGLSIDITIPIPDALVSYGGNNMAGAVITGDQLEELGERFTTINGVPCISFTATHFSPYTIYVDTGNLTEGALDVTPKTGDPIHPKWFLSIGLASLSIILFLKKDRRTARQKMA